MTQSNTRHQYPDVKTLRTAFSVTNYANALPLQPGDNVIFCDMEFPSNVYPRMNLERRGIEARYKPAGSSRSINRP